MYLVNMSNNAVVSPLGILYTSSDDFDEDNFALEHTYIPFVGFNDFDFKDEQGKVILISEFYCRIKDNALHLIKSNKTPRSTKVLLLMSFPIIKGGTFGSFPGSKTPEGVFKFKSGNPDIGYFYEMLFIISRDTKYEILYHSEELSKITKYDIYWNSVKDFVSVTPHIIM